MSPKICMHDFAANQQYAVAATSWNLADDRCQLESNERLHEDVEFTSVEIGLSNQLWCMTSGVLYSEDLGNAFQVQRTQLIFRRCSKMSGIGLLAFDTRWFGRALIVLPVAAIEEGLPRVKVEDAVAWKDLLLLQLNKVAIICPSLNKMRLLLRWLIYR